MTNCLERIAHVATHRGATEAVALGSSIVTYRELQDETGRVTAILRRQGVKPSDRVAVLLEREPAMIAALLGVMASGAAYVPIDPDYPVGRIQHILSDSRPRVVVSRRALLEKLGVATDGFVVIEPDAWRGETPAAASAWSADELAYIIYTSGSTGVPKGVAIQNGALEHYLRFCDDALPASGGGVPLFASIAFDHAVTCVFPPLRWGETLKLLPPLRGGADLACNLLDGHHYSFVKITPSHLRMLSLDERAALGRACDLVMLGGERVDAELVNALRRDVPERRIMNHYGPTEVTVGCCTYEVPVGLTADPIPIGAALPGLRATVRAEDRTECREGEPGELYLAGPSVARGYWNQPALTARAFVTIAGDEDRWYRTGDLVRSEGGVLTYLGRADRQIKLLGHRVELREVEQAIVAVEGVEDVAVVVVPGKHAPVLVAAVVATRQVAPATLRDRAEQLLPAPAVPRLFMMLEQLPVNAHGKLDQTALLERARAELASAATSNDSAPLLASVCGLWGTILNVAPVQPDDDFFDLGGTSIEAIAMLQAVWDQFSVSLDVPSLFANPTARALSRVISEAPRA